MARFLGLAFARSYVALTVSDVLRFSSAAPNTLTASNSAEGGVAQWQSSGLITRLAR